MSDAPKFKTFRDLRSLPPVVNKQSTSTSIPSTSSISSTGAKPLKNFKSEVSPIRDFQKIPNSVPRSLDLFRGKSKQVWDYLWHVSRGSINPVRTIRKSRREIKEGSALGSMVTVDAAIEHLISVGLLKVARSTGSQNGNEYEIFMPEEIDPTYTTSTSTSRYTSLYQKLDVLDVLVSGIGSIGQTVENKDTYNLPNTSLKTNTKNDDEAFAAMLDVFGKMCENANGKIPQKSDVSKWKEFAELIQMELEIAAARTGTISNVPAFLTEHLRRRLIQKTSKPESKPSKPLTKDENKKLPEIEQVEPLSEKGREMVLSTMRGYIEKGQSEFVMSLEETYTAEDWSWLMKSLDKQNTDAAGKKT